VLTPKLDGALTHVYIRNNGPSRAFSYRISKRTGQHIEYTQKIPGLAETSSPGNKKTTLDVRGELVVFDQQGRILPHQEISGYLNSRADTALNRMELEQLKPKIALFDIWDDDRPYEERLSTLRAVADKNPGVFFVPEVAKSPMEKQLLIEKIRSGNYPQTREGVVVDGTHKVKFNQTATVYIHSVYNTLTSGSKFEGTAVGGITYSLTKGGPPIGRVGSGFTDVIRRDIYRNKAKYIGLPIIIEHQGQYETTKAYRAPAFKNFLLA
jgi:ATP-dependent DNA ligase